jgi:CDP-paratose 2-epimerase
LKQGARVALVDDFSRRGTEINLRFIEKAGGERVEVLRGNIKDQDFVRSVLQQHASAAAIFHLAGQVAVTTSMEKPRLDFESNLIGTFNILEAMRELKIRAPILYASTNKVYGSQSSVGVREMEKYYEYVDLPEGTPETFPLDFHSPYGCSKGGADQYVIDYSRCYDIQGIVFRQSCIYGRHQFGIEDQGWVAWFAISAVLGRPITIFGNGKQARDVLFIDDLTDAYWKALGKTDVTVGKAYNIGGGRFRMSLLEFVDILQVQLGKKLDIRFAGLRPGDQKVFICDTRKARADFDWEARVPVEEGVGLLLEWVEKNQDLLKEASNFRSP